MSEMLFNTPVKVHLYLKVHFFHVFLSFYSSLSGIWRRGVGGDFLTRIADEEPGLWSGLWLAANSSLLSEWGAVI